MAQPLTHLYDTRVREGVLRADPAQRQVLARLQELREALEAGPAPRGVLSRLRRAPEAPRGLYLWGGVGRGKSMLMDLFHAHLGIAGKRRVHFHAFMQDVQARLHAARQTGVDDAIRPVAEGIASDLRCLCFDEMHVTDIADAMIVGRLFERLFASGVVVVTTSNRPPDDLYKDGLNRALFKPFIALLQRQLEVVEIGSATDYRQDRLAGARSWFVPADSDAEAAIDVIWQDLTGGPSEPLVIERPGRRVEIARYRSGQARAGFADLCARPLGPGDYLALADRIKLLVLEGIPVLGREKSNEAKRFVTLVDALYEAGVRLVASADAEPENLYPEGTGSFEFRRTASRLREMQAAGWGD